MTSRFIGCEWVAAALILVGVVVFSGCDDSGPLGHQQYYFSVNLVDPYWNEGVAGWIILQSADDHSTIAARRVNRTGLVDLGEIEESHVDLTVARVFPPVNENDQIDIKLTTYMNVPSGSFIDHFGSRRVPIGAVNVTFIFPAGNYDKGLISVAGESHVFHPEPGDTVEFVQMALYETEDDDRISIYGMVQSGGMGHCGWTVDEIYLPLGTISSTLHADRSISASEFHSDVPLVSSGLYGYREPCKEPVNIDYSDADHIRFSDFSFSFGSFPAEKWNLWGVAFLPGNVFLSAQHLSSSIPEEINLPDMALTATPSGSGSMDVQVSGIPDILMCAWNGFVATPPMGRTVYWEAWTGPQSGTVALPQLPDSVLSDLGFTVSNLDPDYQLLWDFEPANGYRDIVRKIYFSDKPWPVQFSDMKAYSNAFGSAATDENSLNGPERVAFAMRQRHHQFLR